MDTLDVVVIGAGLGGSCAAITLAQNGARVALLESGVAARHKVCGEFLSPEARVQLLQLGVLAAMTQGGARSVSAARVLTSRKTSRSVALPHAGLAFSRRALDALLWQRAEALGVETREHARALRIERDEHNTFMIETHTATLRARFVVSATGRGSKLGRDGEAHEGQPQRFVGLKTHLRGARIERGEVQLFPFSGGYCGLVEVEDGSVNACLLADYARSKGRSPEALWREVTAENRALAEATRGATLDFPWLGTGNVSFDRFAPQRDGVLRVGDAAGYIHPLSGDGMAMALRSGELAARVLLHTLSSKEKADDAARVYELLWRREFAARLFWAARLQPLFTNARVTAGAQTFFDALPALSRLAVRRTRGREAVI